MDYFIMHGVIQEDGELVFNSPNSDGKYVIQYIGQNHKTPWVVGPGLCWQLIGQR